MKNLWLIILFILGMAMAARAQESTKQEIKKEVKKGAKKVEKGAKKAGNKTAEVGAKGYSKITDQVYKGKTGPDGQTIYIDNNDRYYWIDDKGKRVYVNASELKDARE